MNVGLEEKREGEIVRMKDTEGNKEGGVERKTGRKGREGKRGKNNGKDEQ